MKPSLYNKFLYVHVENVIVIQTPGQLLHHSIHVDWHVYNFTHYAAVALIMKFVNLHEWQMWQNLPCTDWIQQWQFAGFWWILETIRSQQVWNLIAVQ
jgi:hypothetical protein